MNLKRCSISFFLTANLNELKLLKDIVWSCLFLTADIFLAIKISYTHSSHVSKVAVIFIEPNREVSNTDQEMMPSINGALT